MAHPAFPPSSGNFDAMKSAFGDRFPDLAIALLAHAIDDADGSHDLSHLMRVWRNVTVIRSEEGGHERVLFAATLLHDCVAVAKNSPSRAQASRLAAEKAASLLAALSWPAADIAAVTHAIEAHSFSAGIEPRTLEARILRDADRLDAIGAIGVARCFYTAGRMGSGLYDSADPSGRERPLDERAFAIDHFQTKLLTLAAGFATATGRRMAQERHGRVKAFFDTFIDEVGPSAAGQPIQRDAHASINASTWAATEPARPARS